MKIKNTDTNLHTMQIPKEKLSQFVELFKKKTGRKLSEEEALEQALILLRMTSIIYRPVSISDFNSALVKKLVRRKIESLAHY